MQARKDLEEEKLKEQRRKQARQARALLQRKMLLEKKIKQEPPDDYEGGPSKAKPAKKKTSAGKAKIGKDGKVKKRGQEGKVVKKIGPDGKVIIKRTKVQGQNGKAKKRGPDGKVLKGNQVGKVRKDGKMRKQGVVATAVDPVTGDPIGPSPPKKVKREGSVGVGGVVEGGNDPASNSKPTSAKVKTGKRKKGKAKLQSKNVFDGLQDKRSSKVVEVGKGSGKVKRKKVRPGGVDGASASSAKVSKKRARPRTPLSMDGRLGSPPAPAHTSAARQHALQHGRPPSPPEPFPSSSTATSKPQRAQRPPSPEDSRFVSLPSPSHRPLHDSDHRQSSSKSLKKKRQNVEEAENRLVIEMWKDVNGQGGEDFDSRLEREISHQYRSLKRKLTQGSGGSNVEMENLRIVVKKEKVW